MLNAPRLSGRGNGVVRAAAVQRMQQTHGNRATRAALQRLAPPLTAAPEHPAVTPASTADVTVAPPATAPASSAPAVQRLVPVQRDDFLSGLGNAMGSVAGGAANAVGGAANAVGTAAGGAANAVGTAAGQAANTVGTAAGQAGQAGLEEMLRQIGGDAFVALLHRAGGALGRIVADPGAFLGNLLRGLQAGFQQFAAHLGSHLQTGLQDWLFGQLGGAGLQLPDKLDAGGVFSIVLQLLGLGVGQLRALLVKRLGPQAGALLDEAGTLLTALVQGGLQGLWSEVQDQLGDLQDLVLNGVRDWAITKVVGAAVTKIIAMFTPAGAIFELLQTIWNVFQFVTERLSQLRALGESVLGALEAIANGQVDGVAGKIESVLTSGLSVVLSLLANLVGLGGVSSKIHDTLTQVRARIDNAIDALLDRLIGKAKGRVGNHSAPAAPAAGPADDEAAAHHHGHPNGDDAAADHAGHTVTPAPTAAAPTHPPPTPTTAPGHPDPHAPAADTTHSDQPAPTSDANAGTATPLRHSEVSFNMQNESHKLIFDSTKDEFIMASKQDRLSVKIGRAAGWIIQLIGQAKAQYDQAKQQTPPDARFIENREKVAGNLEGHRDSLFKLGSKAKEAFRQGRKGILERVPPTLGAKSAPPGAPPPVMQELANQFADHAHKYLVSDIGEIQPKLEEWTPYDGESGHTEAMQQAMIATLKKDPHWIAIVRNRTVGAHIWDRAVPQKPEKADAIAKTADGLRLVKFGDGHSTGAELAGHPGYGIVVSDLDVAALAETGQSMNNETFMETGGFARTVNANYDKILPQNSLGNTYDPNIIQHGPHWEGMKEGAAGASARYLLDRVWVYNYTGEINDGPMWKMFKKYIKRLL